MATRRGGRRGNPSTRQDGEASPEMGNLDVMEGGDAMQDPEGQVFVLETPPQLSGTVADPARLSQAIDPQFLRELLSQVRATITDEFARQARIRQEAEEGQPVRAQVQRPTTTPGAPDPLSNLLGDVQRFQNHVSPRGEVRLQPPNPRGNVGQNRQVLPLAGGGVAGQNPAQGRLPGADNRGQRHPVMVRDTGASELDGDTDTETRPSPRPLVRREQYMDLDNSPRRVVPTVPRNLHGNHQGHFESPRNIKMPIFNGKSTEDATPWLHRIERAALDNQWTDWQSLTCALSTSGDTAARWVDRFITAQPDASWVAFKAAANKRFGPPQGENHKYESEWRTRRQAPDEDVDSYVREMLDIAARLDRHVHDAEKTSVILAGVEAELSHEVTAQVYDDFESVHAAILRHARRMTNKQKRSADKRAQKLAAQPASAKPPFVMAYPKSNTIVKQEGVKSSTSTGATPAPNVNSTAAASRPAGGPRPLSEIVCHHCGEKGHYKNQCPKLQKTQIAHMLLAGTLDPNTKVHYYQDPSEDDDEELVAETTTTEFVDIGHLPGYELEGSSSQSKN